MRSTSNTAQVMLARLAMTEIEELHAIYTAHPVAAGGVEGTIGKLAFDAWMALGAIDDAERAADQALEAIGTRRMAQISAAADGMRRDAGWIAQSAGHYAEACAKITAGCDTFNTAAMPLAMLLGREYRAV